MQQMNTKTVGKLFPADFPEGGKSNAMCYIMIEPGGLKVNIRGPSLIRSHFSGPLIDARNEQKFLLLPIR